MTVVALRREVEVTEPDVPETVAREPVLRMLKRFSARITATEREKLVEGLLQEADLRETRLMFEGMSDELLADPIALDDLMEKAIASASIGMLALVADLFGGHVQDVEHLVEVALNRDDLAVRNMVLPNLVGRLRNPLGVLERLFEERKPDLFAVVAHYCRLPRLDETDTLLLDVQELVVETQKHKMPEVQEEADAFMIMLAELRGRIATQQRP